MRQLLIRLTQSPSLSTSSFFIISFATTSNSCFNRRPSPEVYHHVCHVLWTQCFSLFLPIKFFVLTSTNHLEMRWGKSEREFSPSRFFWQSSCPHPSHPWLKLRHFELLFSLFSQTIFNKGLFRFPLIPTHLFPPLFQFSLPSLLYFEAYGKMSGTSDTGWDSWRKLEEEDGEDQQNWGEYNMGVKNMKGKVHEAHILLQSEIQWPSEPRIWKERTKGNRQHFHSEIMGWDLRQNIIFGTFSLKHQMIIADYITTRIVMILSSET